MIPALWHRTPQGLADTWVFAVAPRMQRAMEHCRHYAPVILAAAAAVAALALTVGR